MASVWRAAGLAPSERTDSFVDLVCRSIVPYGDPVGMVLGPRDEVRTAEVGALRILTLAWTRGAASRAVRELRRSDPELCKIDVSLAGRFALEQSDRQAVPGAGSFTFVDLSRPHRVAARRCELTVVMFPRSALPLRDRDIGDLAGTTFDRTQPGAALVSSVVREMTDNLDAYEGPTGARLGAVLLDLIGATLAGRVDRPPAAPSESRRRALVVAIRAYIEENLSCPTLGPAAICARHHISPRYLHKLFEDQGTTVAALIRSRRLEHCRRDLLDPALAATPVSAIAHRWGYPDPAYFNRVFRAEHGLPPAEFRRVTGQPAATASRSRWA
ncbi:helix-turn-helix domain-containing protein [Asanoa sp. WMMD1127]|uniref:helix-turn-helix domain-containing protein n=1 Tax=Asanoa sp. WMMD1127 TaxID=3016107 RepID=UPI0024160DFB|nr:helix-turn-helix domain-containing protein [Asanoa sp. WMMD1127]MDG4824703.1 helix-turn-helix domain-containing protein [Asanoa sp. WMMD1127]